MLLDNRSLLGILAFPGALWRPQRENNAAYKIVCSHFFSVRGRRVALVAMSSPESFRHSSVTRCVPERPKVQPAFAQDPALMPGDTYDTAPFTRFLHRCSHSELQDLRVWFHHVKGGKLHIATACSGTDVPLLVYNGLAAAVAQVLGVDVQVIHQFSCERNKAKQAFIKSMFEDVPLMFVDATKLGPEKCFDAISGTQIKVPEGTESFLVGWPCTDVSTMNKYSSSSQNRACVIS